MPTGSIEDFALPPGLLAAIEAVASDERRPAADIVREALERYLSQHEALHETPIQARALGLPDDDEPVTEAYRSAVRAKIAQGLASAKAGRLVDGEAVFSRLFKVLEKPERSDRG